MNRKDIEKMVAGKLGVSETNVRPYIQTFLEAISDCLKHENHVTIQNFGSFKPWKQSSRPVRNPRTGEPCILEPRLSVKFTPGKALFAKMNDSYSAKSLMNKGKGRMDINY